VRSLLRKLDGWWYARFPADRIATLRVAIGAFAWIYLLIRLPYFVALTEQPARFFRPVGVLVLLSQPLPAVALHGLCGAALLAGAAFVLGVWFRVAGPVFAVLFLVVTTYGSSWGMVFHHENIVALQLLVLGFSAAADGRSLDARRRLRPPPADGRYGWPVRLLCVLLVATYLLAGIAKLKGSGWDWLTGVALREQIAYNGLRKLAFAGQLPLWNAFLVKHGGLLVPFAWATLAFELGAPLALLGRRAGLLWSAVAWSFHVAVLITMSISFFYPLSGLAFLCFFEPEKLSLRRGGERRRGGGGTP
jgi:hypothetical protein